MVNPSGTQVPDESTNHEQNQGANNASVPIVAIGNNSATNAGGAGSGLGADVRAGGGNEGNPGVRIHEPLHSSPSRATFITLEPNEDILERLAELAKEKEVFILMGMGSLSYIELCNRKDAPVANTVLQGLFSINSLDGNMVIPNENEPYRGSRVDVLVTSEDGRVRGGPARKLISKSQVHVMVSSKGRAHFENCVRNAHTAWCKGEGPYFPNVDDLFNRDYIDKIYEQTLDELNEKNSFAWRHSNQLNK